MNQRNKKTTIISIATALLIIVIGLAAAAYALTLESPKKESMTTESSEAQSNHGDTTDDEVALADRKVGAVIVYSDKGFENTSYSVSAGEVVEVENKSNKDFYFTIGSHENHDMHSPLSLGALKPGESARFVAPEPGVYGFHNHDDQTEEGALAVQ